MSGKKSMWKWACGLAVAGLGIAAAPSLAQQEYCRTSRGNVGNGYHYEMWIQDGTPGNACLTVFEEQARFKTTWNLQGYGFVARVGLLFDQTRTDEQIGWIISDFEHSLEGQGHAWVGIYGWTVDPLIEYYILEDWIGWKPQYTRMGTIQVDGGEYEVFTNTRVQQPSIKGTQTFEQWYSVRKSQRRSGRISVSEHFAQWRALGMRTGKLYEAKLKVEGLNGSGSVEFTKATVEIGHKDVSTFRPGVWAKGGRTPKQGGLLYTPKGSRVGPVAVGKSGSTQPHGRLPAGIYLVSPAEP